jgi:hypothetical protein
MDSRCPPEGIDGRHLQDQLANLGGDAGPASQVALGFRQPGPESSEPLPLPANCSRPSTDRARTADALPIHIAFPTLRATVPVLQVLMGDLDPARAAERRGLVSAMSGRRYAGIRLAFGTRFQCGHQSGTSRTSVLGGPSTRLPRVRTSASERTDWDLKLRVWSGERAGDLKSDNILITREGRIKILDSAWRKPRTKISLLATPRARWPSTSRYGSNGSSSTYMYYQLSAVWLCQSDPRRAAVVIASRAATL